IIRRSLELENKFIYYDSRDKIQSYTKAKKLQILSKYYSEGGISQTEVDEGFKNIDEHYFIDFVNLISPKLKLISNKTNYFDLRYSKNKQMLFLSNIIDRVKIGKKFIFVRLSDGESYGYTNDNELSRRQEVHWWGEVLSEELRNKIKNDFSNAIFTTRFDFLGIPTHYKYIHYIANKNNKEISIKDNLDTNVINRLSFSLFSIIDAYSNERVCVDNFVEDQINNVMFTKENLRVLSKNANRTIVISGYKEKHIHETFNNDSIIVKEIPTHNLLSGSDKTCNSSLPLPYKYDEVREWISSNVKNGDLCFISAGFIGKIFACDALKNGAIVLDIGQSLNKDGI
ncbi:hypothetical protein, partial [Vibrio breoganii]|uniref:hypothetical protein n=1 Tax=Vibrio breoganii TaxID=553239 RepID=UPI0012FFFFB4